MLGITISTIEVNCKKEDEKNCSINLPAEARTLDENLIRRQYKKIEFPNPKRPQLKK